MSSSTSTVEQPTTTPEPTTEQPSAKPSAKPESAEKQHAGTIAFAAKVAKFAKTRTSVVDASDDMLTLRVEPKPNTDAEPEEFRVALDASGVVSVTHVGEHEPDAVVWTREPTTTEQPTTPEPDATDAAKEPKPSAKPSASAKPKPKPKPSESKTLTPEKLQAARATALLKHDGAYANASGVSAQQVKDMRWVVTKHYAGDALAALGAKSVKSAVPVANGTKPPSKEQSALWRDASKHYGKHAFGVTGANTKNKLTGRKVACVLLAVAEHDAKHAS